MKKIVCHECGSNMYHDTQYVVYIFGKIKCILDQPGWYCSACNESILGPDDLAATRDALDAFREQIKMKYQHSIDRRTVRAIFDNS